MAIADARQAVFVPPVRPRPGVVVGEVVPGGAVGTVVLPDAAPGAFAHVRAPALPVLEALSVLFEAQMFGCCAHDMASMPLKPRGFAVIQAACTTLPDPNVP